jgi:hypothetical protein
MGKSPGPKRMKGVARVAFLAHRAEIEAELEAGWPIKAVYEKRADKLGMSYQQFHRYVTAIIRGQSPTRSEPPATPTPAPAPATTAPENKPDVGQPSARPRTFEFDGNPKPDDRERLLGIKPREQKD